MRTNSRRFVLLLALLLLFIVSVGATAREPQTHFEKALPVPQEGAGIVVEPIGASGKAVYIVRLQDAPLASYYGEKPGMSETSPAALGSAKLDLYSRASNAYRDYLRSKQSLFIAATEQNLGREVDVIYQYDVAFNGLSLVMTSSEAAKLAQQPGVVTIQRDLWRQAQTDVSPAFIGADKVWDGSAVPGVGTKGEGIIVGIIDTGIWPEHPSFTDDGSYPLPPAGWAGICQPPSDASQPLTCTNKLIGARHFLAGYISAVGAYDGLFNSTRDDHGHGTHTASTAAGNENTSASLLGIDRGQVSGIAPRAHVAAYKALGPRGGVLSDLIAAIDAAVADGVDVINYSVGSGASDPWIDADSLAFLAARDAGVFVATSAGNSGPDANTVGSPGNAPWITTVAASTSSRQFISDITLAGPGTPPADLFGASVTGGVANFNLVDAEGIADQGGDATGRCINPYPAGTFQATDVVLCKRGVVARVIRGANVQAGGGGGVILYNDDPAQGLSTDNYVIPAVHVLNETGLQIKQYLTSNPGAVKISFTQGAKAYENSDSRVKSDMIADFSSRGPNELVLDVIKPDVTAPGVQILAGNTPQCEPSDDSCGAQGQLFMAIQGTSMSSPHVAGAAALIANLHPTWSPSEIESALMTTANRNALKEDGSTQADPFDMGGGRIELPAAANAPLVLHESKANYLAADPYMGGDPKTLNNASLGNSECTSTCSWTRKVSNSSDYKVTWDAYITGLVGTVVPTNFTLSPGEEIAITTTVIATGLAADQWSFGSLEIVPRTGGGVPADLPVSYLPIGVMPGEGNPLNGITIRTRRDAGSFLMEDLQTVDITEMTIVPHGLLPGLESDMSLKEDPTKNDPYDDLSQVWFGITKVPSRTVRLVNVILQSTAPDADLFVGFDDNGNGRPDPDEEVCASITDQWQEQCNIESPKKGDWWVLVQNWTASDPAAYDDISLATGVVPGEDMGNMTFDAPEFVPLLQPFDITVMYDLTNTYAGQAWFGSFSIGSEASNPGNVGNVMVNLYREEDDVLKSADKKNVMPGDMVKYTIRVNSNVLNEDLDYKIQDMIPDGLTYVSKSAEASSGTVVVDGSKLTWTGEIDGLETAHAGYTMSTSNNDPLCDTGYGGYVNLEDYNINTLPGIAGDSIVHGFFNGNPIDFYGVEYPQMHITDDGFILFDKVNNYQGDPKKPQHIPNVKKPGNLAAIMWQDMEVVYDGPGNKGVTAATEGDNVIVVEYDDIQLFQDSSNSYDFEIVMRREVDNRTGAYEIVFAYDNINGLLNGPLTIGVENAAGDNATAHTNKDSAAGEITDGMMICFDSIAPIVDATITYEVTVDEDLLLGDLLTNRAVSTTSNRNSKKETTYATIMIGHPTFNPIILSKGQD